MRCYDPVFLAGIFGRYFWHARAVDIVDLEMSDLMVPGTSYQSCCCFGFSPPLLRANPAVLFGKVSPKFLVKCPRNSAGVLSLEQRVRLSPSCGTESLVGFDFGRTPIIEPIGVVSCDFEINFHVPGLCKSASICIRHHHSLAYNRARPSTETSFEARRKPCQLPSPPATSLASRSRR
jgi:hypothetical protein